MPLIIPLWAAVWLIFHEKNFHVFVSLSDMCIKNGAMFILPFRTQHNYLWDFWLGCCSTQVGVGNYYQFFFSGRKSEHGVKQYFGLFKLIRMSCWTFRRMHLSYMSSNGWTDAITFWWSSKNEIKKIKNALLRAEQRTCDALKIDERDAYTLTHIDRYASYTNFIYDARF